MFISEAFASTAQHAAAGQTPFSGFLIQMFLVFAIFYFIIIRPQQKKMKEHEDMLNAIQPKDELITGGGVYGRVIKADKDTLTVEISKGVEIKVLRSSVREVVSKTQTSTEKKIS
ncbi:MAG: preprotein translocase subunit YajC [Alphaproteobacteria bacterium]|nr:preprotein translocase subunit YajC [Alphaproteobacteria bacterium]